MKNIFKISIIIAAFGFFQACDNNLELEPITALDASVGFKTKQDVDAALLGAYNSIQSSNYFGLQLQVLPDLYADNINHTGTFPTYAQIFNRQVLADNSNIGGLWNTVYVAVNRANNVIASVPTVKDPSFNANNAIGEARLLRAFHYFNLVALFGGSPAGFNKAGGLGVPIYTVPTLSAEDAAPKARSSEEEVWKLILEDINFAVANLAVTNGNGRANKNVALALKARIHGVRNEWALAEAAASEVINSKRHTLLTTANYQNIWLSQNSTEAIWELQFDINNTNSVTFWYYPGANGGRNEFTSSNSLRDAHEAGDVRRVVNVSAAPANKTMKYTRVNGIDNVLLIRLAEMHLIRAEAYANLNRIAESLTELNAIRKRAGLSDAAETTSAGLVNAILKERRLEFAHEGYRWLDLRRTGRWNATGLTEDFRSRWPIPQREVQTSAGLITQNTGY
jgi:starch-binding outer membrane protein, SusD/RagB family